MAGMIGRPYTQEELLLLRENEALRNRHHGMRCFILGTGSSIARQDLKKLAGEVVMTVSNFFVHPDMSIIRPRYHVLPPVLASHLQYNSVESYMEWFAEMERKTGDAELFFHIGDRAELLTRGLYRNRTVHWVDYESGRGEQTISDLDLAMILPIWSVSETAITVALYLGFSEIYLLGFDHDWFNGLHVYFHRKDEHKVQTDKSNLAFIDSEFQMRRHADIFRKYKFLFALRENIFNANANPDSYVDVFPKVDFDSLFVDKDTNYRDTDSRLELADLIYRYKQAVNLYESNNCGDALLLLDSVIRDSGTQPRIAGLEFLKARCLAKLDRTEEALLWARRDYASNPNNRDNALSLIQRLEAALS
jgi:hypothetical protein